MLHQSIQSLNCRSRWSPWRLGKPAAILIRLTLGITVDRSPCTQFKVHPVVTEDVAIVPELLDDARSHKPASHHF